MITAHSGCDNTKDNSMEFVEYAMKEHAECIEVDVRKYEKDFILSHDEAKENECVKLSQVFEMMKNKEVKVNCDLKQKKLEEEVYALAKEYGVEDQIIYTGYVELEKCKEQTNFENVQVYMNVENLSKKIEALFLGENISEEEIIKEMEMICEMIKDTKIAGLNLPWQLVNEKTLQIFQMHNVAVSVWTVNDLDKARELMEWNVENITTRRFHEIRALRVN